MNSINDGTRALLLKCFDHLNRDIKKRTLNETASDGTQALSREIAEHLDAQVVSATPAPVAAEGETPLTEDLAIAIRQCQIGLSQPDANPVQVLKRFADSVAASLRVPEDKEDGARLAWLEENARRLDFTHWHDGYRLNRDESEASPNLRAAIDRARTAPSTQPATQQEGVK